jgi:hypothetical protein
MSTERDSREGMHCPLYVGDMVRIVRSHFRDLVGSVHTIEHIYPPGRKIRHLQSGGTGTTLEECYVLSDIPIQHIVFGRSTLYKLPDDWHDVTARDRHEHVMEDMDRATRLVEESTD